MATIARAELVALAAPKCATCGKPITSTQVRYYLTNLGVWTILHMAMVCEDQHRTMVHRAD